MENIISSKTRIEFEIVEKMRKILKSETLSEPEIFYLFNLSRKLLEQLPIDARKKFALLKFYCDWMVHSTIDQSSAGALIIEKLQSAINNATNNGIKIKNFLPLFDTDIFRILSFGEMFTELKEFIELFKLTDCNYYKQFLKNFNKYFVLNNALGIGFVENMLEIISFSPLMINPSNRYLKPILERIRNDKDGSIGKYPIIKQIAIIKLTPTHLLPKLPKGHTYGCIYWVEIDLSDSTRIMQALDMALG